jgi:hypothetical protein
MLIREPVVAGQFYPATSASCTREIEALLPREAPEEAPERPVAGIVPHAGWVFSGATALRVLDAIRRRRTPRTFVLFGAVHSPIRASAVFSHGGWQTPLGLVEVDERLAGEVLARAGHLLQDNPVAHENEHSLEVQLPFIRHLFPEARIVPISVLPTPQAAEIGRLAAQAIQGLAADAVCLGSTDLTHYGPAYGFAPKGFGAAALRWVREENDRRMVDLMSRLDAEAVVEEAREHLNACGAGAVAATLAAARELGAAKGYVLRYTTSADVMRDEMGRTDSSATVGYAGVVF